MSNKLTRVWGEGAHWTIANTGKSATEEALIINKRLQTLFGIKHFKAYCIENGFDSTKISVNCYLIRTIELTPMNETIPFQFVGSRLTVKEQEELELIRISFNAEIGTGSMIAVPFAQLK